MPIKTTFFKIFGPSKAPPRPSRSEAIKVCQKYIKVLYHTVGTGIADTTKQGLHHPHRYGPQYFGSIFMSQGPKGVTEAGVAQPDKQNRANINHKISFFLNIGLPPFNVQVNFKHCVRLCKGQRPVPWIPLGYPKVGFQMFRLCLGSHASEKGMLCYSSALASGALPIARAVCWPIATPHQKAIANTCSRRRTFRFVPPSFAVTNSSFDFFGAWLQLWPPNALQVGLHGARLSTNNVSTPICPNLSRTTLSVNSTHCHSRHDPVSRRGQTDPPDPRPPRRC